MKQFQKLGVAAAVASVAAGTVAEVSRTETGDLAIIPYYTVLDGVNTCLLYTSPSPRDATLSRMPSSA